MPAHHPTVLAAMRRSRCAAPAIAPAAFLLAALLALAGATATAGVAAAQTVGGALPQPLPLFPRDNWWNVDVTSAPVDANSTNFINWIGTSRGMHPDFGGDVDPTDPTNPNIYGFPYVTVPGTQALVPVTFVLSPDQSDDGAAGHPAGYPIPSQAETQAKWIEGGTPGGGTSQDYHMLIVDTDNRILYELYQAHWNVDHWEAGSGAIFQLDSDARRPEGWTSADAAGLAILPGLVRYDEAFGSGPILHAFRFTLRDSNGYVYPGSHVAGSNTSAPPLGARLRLRASVDLSPYTPEVQRIFQAMKTYGLILADNGSDMYVQGTYDTRWNNDVLNPAFASLTASDFDVVELGWQPPTAPSGGPYRFFTLPPCRLLDTRLADGPHGGPAVPPNSQRVVVVAGQCGIPATARAVAANVTVVAAPAAGFLAFFPGDAQVPPTSTINFRSGRVLANNAVLGLASSGSGTLALSASTPNPVHLLIDVSGYFE
ncbi:MAG TPA: hypothetical protein VKY89_18340 [Thermoanaerobaculia bacterium]|nr:hypothetical protein [Thermoanaerobaculia bacterium]